MAADGMQQDIRVRSLFRSEVHVSEASLFFFLRHAFSDAFVRTTYYKLRVPKNISKCMRSQVDEHARRRKRT